MSIPTSGEYPAGVYPGVSAPPTNQVNFGWITESWQLLMAHTGIWIAATLALIGPSVVLGVGLYAYFMVTMLQSGVFTPRRRGPRSPAPPRLRSSRPAMLGRS